MKTTISFNSPLPVSIAILITVSFAHSAPAGPADPITLADAIARVEAGHPFMRDREVQARLAGARIATAEVRPTGEISLAVENALGTGDHSGVRGAETTLQFGRELESALRRSARVAVARSLNETDRIEWEERRRAVLIEAARRFVDVAAAQADHELARASAEIASATEAAIRERFAKAVASPADVARAHHARVETDIETEHTEHALLAARQGLAVLWGADSPDFGKADADLDTLTPTPGFETQLASLDGTPAQARLAALGRWRHAQLDLARESSARGTPRWSAGIRRLEATDDWGFVMSIAYSLPNRASGSAGMAESRAERERLEAEIAAERIEASRVLFELHQELGHARIEHAAAANELIPAAEAWLAHAEEGIRAGRFALRDVLDAQAALLEARRHRLTAAAQYHRALIAIEGILGSPPTTNP